MAATNSEKIIRELLESAQIEVNGKNPWDIQVHNPEIYSRVLNEASLGLGESYMDGWWDCEALDQLIYRILKANLDRKVTGNWKNCASGFEIQAAESANPLQGAEGGRGGV